MTPTGVGKRFESDLNRKVWGSTPPSSATRFLSFAIYGGAIWLSALPHKQLPGGSIPPVATKYRRPHNGRLDDKIYASLAQLVEVAGSKPV